MFSRHVVNRDLKDQRISGIVGHVLFEIIAFREILGPNLPQKAVFPLLLRHFRNAPETDDAGKAVPPLAGILHGLRKHREADLVICPDGIQLMPGLGTMEVNLSVQEQIIDRMLEFL